MTQLILIPGLAGNESMWRAQLPALARWQPRVSDAHARADTVPAMAELLLREHAGLALQNAG